MFHLHIRTATTEAFTVCIEIKHIYANFSPHLSCFLCDSTMRTALRHVNPVYRDTYLCPPVTELHIFVYKLGIILGQQLPPLVPPSSFSFSWDTSASLPIKSNPVHVTPKYYNTPSDQAVLETELLTQIRSTPKFHQNGNIFEVRIQTQIIQIQMQMFGLISVLINPNQGILINQNTLLTGVGEGNARATRSAERTLAFSQTLQFYGLLLSVE